MEDHESKNRKIGWVISIGIHAGLLMFFFLVLAWSEPDPPIPEYGIELNFGQVKASESNPDSEQTKPVERAVESESEGAPVHHENEQQTPGETTEVETTAARQSEEETAVTEDINSADLVEENKNEVSEDNGSGESTPEIVESSTEVSDTEEETQMNNAEENEQPVIDERAIFKKGEKRANADAKGSSLELAGWNWDFKPRPNDNSTENGIIVFQVVIDSEGEIIGLKTLEKTVSPAVEKIYKEAVLELTFSRTSDNNVVANRSTGKITFIIQSK